MRQSLIINSCVLQLIFIYALDIRARYYFLVMTDSYFMPSLKAAIRKQHQFCFCFDFLLNSTALPFLSQNTTLPCIQQANYRVPAKDHGGKAGKGIQGFPQAFTNP